MVVMEKKECTVQMNLCALTKIGFATVLRIVMTVQMKIIASEISSSTSY